MLRPRTESNRLVPGLQSGAFPFGNSAVCVEETGRVELPGLEARPFSKRVCNTGMHVVSAEESGGIEPLTVRSPRCSGPVTDHSVALSAAGCRGIEPRWPGLEPSLIPDRCPGRGGEPES